MRHSIFIVVIAGALLLSCKKESVPASFSNQLVLNECKSFGSDSLPVICFDSLITDSRCPANAVCIWQGVVVVKLSFRDAAGSQNFYLSSLTNHPFFPANDTSINGYKIRLLDVSYSSPTGERTGTPKAYLAVFY